MDATLNDEELPLYSQGYDPITAQEGLQLLGFYPGYELRKLISQQKATFSREEGTGRRRVILTEKAEVSRARALSSAGATQALSTTYTENLYPDSPAQLAHKKENGIEPTVTATVISMKKYRGPRVGFVPYNATEGFARKRFNPDRPPKPLFWSARAAERAILGR
jgi:hypothetical protein